MADKTVTVELGENPEQKEKVIGKVLARAVYIEVDGEKKKLFRAGEKLHLHRRPFRHHSIA